MNLKTEIKGYRLKINYKFEFSFFLKLMHVTQISIGRFHHFHLARQLEKRNLLEAIYTGYPRFKIKDEPGIPKQKIYTFPWLHAPYMARGRLRLDRSIWLDREWAWWAHESLDHYVASRLKDNPCLIALSGSGLYSGYKAQRLGGFHICDRGSSHIRHQEELLSEEYRRYGSRWRGIDPRVIEKEEAEYEQADLISIPSAFCYNSFLKKGISSNKLIKIPYGARLERFYPDTTINPNRDQFTIFFVGQASPRKGFIDLLAAFDKFSHPNKQLILAGSMSNEATSLLERRDCSNIKILGLVPNDKLRFYYNNATVFVLPSIEEGLAMVIGEAMASGCPVIATTNTGASEMITNGIDGFIVPIRSPQSIADHFELLADQPEIRNRISNAALLRVKRIGGWDYYGEQWSTVLTSF